MRILLLFVAMLAASPAHAGVPVCSATIEDHAAALAEAYGEQPFWLGLNGGDGASGMVMIFARPDMTSWTVVLIDRAGKSCSLTGGNAWLPRAPSPEKDA